MPRAKVVAYVEMPFNVDYEFVDDSLVIVHAATPETFLTIQMFPESVRRTIIHQIAEETHEIASEWEDTTEELVDRGVSPL
jgi:hypothetical protein